jgi:hypothetical protein
MGINYWHIDSYRADQRAYCGEYALWCGSDSLWIDGYPLECGTWDDGKYPGYGDEWHCIAQLTLPPTFDVANGCTLFFDPRYDTECKYDYLYVEFHNGTKWKTLATFNASSNNPGAECGYVSGAGNPDYWGNTDAGQPGSADWQERALPDKPAFYRVITPDTLIVTSAPMFRWRFHSDLIASDSDGRIDTDGAAFVDNVWVWGDDERYSEDFESGVLDTGYWTLPNPDGVIDQWHMSHGIGPEAAICIGDTSTVYRARPEGGYQGGTSWRNGWYYRLITPAVPIQNSGCLIQYDEWECFSYSTCDYHRVKFRFYSADQDRWCPWQLPDWIWLEPSCAGAYYTDFDVDLSQYYDSDADSMQFAWDISDWGQPGDFCWGKHTGTDLAIDNVSIGFYDAGATSFWVRGSDMLHDTFHDNLCAYNASFDVYDPDTLAYYSGPPYDKPMPRYNQLYVSLVELDGVDIVELFGSLDEGRSWQSVMMTLDPPSFPLPPRFGVDYYGTLCPDDFELAAWDTGTVVWYYVKVTDDLANVEYWPATADPAHPRHTGGVESYSEFAVLPTHPPEYSGPRVLLVNGDPWRTQDYSPCVETVDREVYLRTLYGRTLTDAGYCYDVFDVTWGGSSEHLHPVGFGDHYDCVVWFIGCHTTQDLFDGEAQEYLREFLGSGGKVVIAGDQIPWAMDQEGRGDDALGGEFLAGILGGDYLEWMEDPPDKPYLYAAAVESLSVLGTPTEIGLDSMAIYRECPSWKDMSYVALIDSPPAGYTAQSLMYLTNASVGSADEVIYTEYLGTGQCVFINFDLSASVNHERGYCSGVTHIAVPGFAPGIYDGRVEMIRTILEDIFGLPSNGGGSADVDDPPVSHRWALHQNVPNPCPGATEIRYELARPAVVSIKVYNPQGQVVKVLESGSRDAGPHAVRWGGRNTAGERVASGVYFYKIEADPFSATRKMLILR